MDDKSKNNKQKRAKLSKNGENNKSVSKDFEHPEAKNKKTTPRAPPLLDAISGNSYIDSMDLQTLMARRDLSFKDNTRRAYNKRYKALSKAYDEFKTKELIDLRNKKSKARVDRRRENGINARDHIDIIAESELGDMNSGTPEIAEVHENVTDHTGEASEEVRVNQRLHSLEDGGATQYELNDFFSRPFSVFDDSWVPEAEQSVALDLWNLWSLNPSVRAKLSNYAYFKGNLHVKIAVSGTPFHYGCIMASYQPYPEYNSVLQGYNTLNNSTNPGAEAVRPPFKCYLSQALGISYIDVKENKPVCMEIPFISYKENYRIFNQAGTLITNATELYDFKEAGTLHLRTLNQIKVANDDHSSPVSINVYVWMTDVELGCITGTDINITAESGRGKKKAHKIVSKKHKKKSFISRTIDKMESAIDNGGSDEHSDPGPVSKVATAVGTIGDTLKDVPFIGPFARATAGIANKVGKFASFFGFSKPSVLDSPIYVKNKPFQNGSTVAGHITVDKLTADPKQELSIDPSYCGGGPMDELSIKHISSKESFLTSFPWTDADTALTTILWTTLVTPSVGSGFTDGVNNVRLFQPTPMAYAVNPFLFWRGTIRYRFEIVCSKFHRGKLLIKYEPNVTQIGVMNSNPTQLNQQNAIIIDIQDAQEIIIDVDWANHRAWCTVQRPGFENSAVDTPDTEPAQAVPSTSGSINTGSCNGYLQVRVLNELVQPTTTSDVSVNVYVSCEDLEVAAPDDIKLRRLGDIVAESELVDSQISETINPTNSSPLHVFEDHFGEKLESFRALLKRYQTAYSAVVENVGTANELSMAKFTGYMYPPPLYDPTTSGSTFPVNTQLKVNILFQYLRFAYLGMRGGIRYRAVVHTMMDNSGPANYTFVNRSTLRDRSEGTSFTPTISKVILSTLENEVCSTFNGTITNHLPSNGGVEFEMPYYSNNLFQFSSALYEGAAISEADAETSQGFNPTYPCTFEYRTTITSVEAENAVMFNFDMSTAEDFNFLRFLGAPFWTEGTI